MQAARDDLFDDDYDEDEASTADDPEVAVWDVDPHVGTLYNCRIGVLGYVSPSGLREAFHAGRNYLLTSVSPLHGKQQTLVFLTDKGYELRLEVINHKPARRTYYQFEETFVAKQ